MTMMTSPRASRDDSVLIILAARCRMELDQFMFVEPDDGGI